MVLVSIPALGNFLVPPEMSTPPGLQQRAKTKLDQPWCVTEVSSHADLCWGLKGTVGRGSVCRTVAGVKWGRRSTQGLEDGRVAWGLTGAAWGHERSFAAMSLTAWAPALAQSTLFIFWGPGFSYLSNGLSDPTSQRQPEGRLEEVVVRLLVLPLEWKWKATLGAWGTAGGHGGCAGVGLSKRTGAAS